MPRPAHKSSPAIRFGEYANRRSAPGAVAFTVPVISREE
jgi:hypothetical protein